MRYYKIAGIIIKSEFRLACFEDFLCEESQESILISKTVELPPSGADVRSGSIIHRRLKDGWFFYDESNDQAGVYISNDYTNLRILGVEDDIVLGTMEWFVRIAIECVLARKGYVSLHAASVELNGEAFAFSAPSGVGKSTRAEAWIKELNAKLINGDRPLIDVRQGELYGVPWDGKEHCFRNVHYPLRVICEVRRSASVYIRKMTFTQRRKLLLQQCFLPMWDTETAAIQMANINRLAKSANIVRIFCGPSEEDARRLYDEIKENKYLEEKKDMVAKQGFVLRNVEDAGRLYDEIKENKYLEEKKDMVAKQGFVLRNVVDEHILMPTGDNIGKFNGTVLFNDVSAFVWEKLQSPMSREDLLQAVLDEFEVEKDAAEADLDALLKQLYEFGVIEE